MIMRNFADVRRSGVDRDAGCAGSSVNADEGPPSPDSNACSRASTWLSALRLVLEIAKGVKNEGFGLHKTRSRSLVIGDKSVLFPVDRVVRVLGTLALAVNH